MSQFRTRTLGAALLAAALSWSTPALAEEPTEPEAASAEGSEAEAATEEDQDDAEERSEAGSEADESGTREERVEIDVTDDELWEMVNPWEDEGIRTHGTGGSDEAGIRMHGGGQPGGEIPTHTGTSADPDRIPVGRIGESGDEEIVIHGTGSRRATGGIRVHGMGGSRD